MAKQNINFDSLVSQIETTNEVLQNNARLVINRHVTAKAWLTGYYIVEYEQKGSDRAKYGDRLLQNLSKRLGKRNFSTTNLKISRQFYLTYPSLLSEIGKFILSYASIGQSLTDLLPAIYNEETTIHTKPELLFNKLSLLDTDEDVFISKYELNIPSKERMAEFLRKENEGLNKEDRQ